METASGSQTERVKLCLPWALLLSALLFLAIFFVPGTRQSCIFRYAELCDYRYFIHPVMNCDCPYSAPPVELKDACYPAIAYCALKAVANDVGRGWQLAKGEATLLASLFVAQLLGLLLLVRAVPRATGRTVTAIALAFSSACICTVLRGNPSGWAFALVCIFVSLHRSESAVLRTLAAVSLGAATSLKLTPCLFGCLYLSDAFSSPRRIPWRDIAVAASSAILLTFLSFAMFGGFCEIRQWVCNALANSDFYSSHVPMWGFIPFANQFIDSREAVLPSIRLFAAATRVLAVVMVAFALAAKDNYRRMLYIGAAMAFLTHHDYGGAYLIPAFVAWLCDGDAPASGVQLLLEAVAWFVIFTPLQFPCPFLSGTLNVMLQNECLFVLLAASVFPRRSRRMAV